MDKAVKDFLDTYYYGSYWAFRHYEKIIRKAFHDLPRRPEVAVEVGCGDGMATYFLSREVHHLICIDTNEACIEKAKDMIKETGIRNVIFMKTDLDRISLDKEADLIFFKDVLHHMNSPVDYLRSCLPFSKSLLIVEANRYNPLLYWICKNVEEERQFLKINSLRHILGMVEKAGWRYQTSRYVECAAYPIGYCFYHDVFKSKRIVKPAIQSLERLYQCSFVSSLIDKGEDFLEKIALPFCSEFIITATRTASSNDH